jgi:hypothetical protein
MNHKDLIGQIVATYHKHGWQLHRVLLVPETHAEISNLLELTGNVPVDHGIVDALWFTRPSHGDREAWELRLIAETPYALFEIFEAGVSEEDKEAAKQEMEDRLGRFTNRTPAETFH